MDMFGPSPKRGLASVELRRFKLPRVETSEDQAATDSLGGGEASEAGCGLTDLLIQGLVERLPAPNAVWPLDERANWLRTAASVFDLVYKDREREHRAISIAVASQDLAPPSARRGPDFETDLSA